MLDTVGPRRFPAPGRRTLRPADQAAERINISPARPGTSVPKPVGLNYRAGGSDAGPRFSLSDDLKRDLLRADLLDGARFGAEERPGNDSDTDGLVLGERAICVKSCKRLVGAEEEGRGVAVMSFVKERHRPDITRVGD